MGARRSNGREGIQLGARSGPAVPCVDLDASHLGAARRDPGLVVSLPRALCNSLLPTPSSTPRPAVEEGPGAGRSSCADECEIRSLRPVCLSPPAAGCSLRPRKRGGVDPLQGPPLMRAPPICRYGLNPTGGVG